MTSQKRSAEEDIPPMRYTRIKLESPSPERTSDSDTESIHSYQGYKTELVKDTSDTSSPPASQPYNVEYEVTDADNKTLYYYLSGDTDNEDFNLIGPSVSNDFCKDNFDDAALGDTSEENSTSPTSNSDVDPGLPRSDYLDFEKCLLCQTEEKDISYPYCCSCFHWKKNFFPHRPKRHRRKIGKYRKILEDSIGKIENGESVGTDKEETSNDRVGVQGIGDGDSGLGSSEGQQSEDTVDGPSTSSATSNSSNSQQSSSSDKMCKVCFMRPEDGLFVHLNIAHIYGCYRCANKIWYHNGGCPICRRKVFKIVKLV